MTVIKVLVQEIIISLISFYVPQCGLDGSQKDDFHDSLVNDVKQLEEREIVVIAGDLMNTLTVPQKNIRTSMEL